jgi:hypothetical protein
MTTKFCTSERTSEVETSVTMTETRSCCTMTMRLRKVCQSSNAPAYGLSVQQCSCTRSDSAAILLCTVCQCGNASEHTGLSLQQCSCARSVSVVMRLSTLVCQYSNFCPLKMLFYPSLRTRLNSSLVILSCVHERNHMYEIVVSRVCRKFMKNP